MTKLLYQGHASYRITTNEGKIIYIDPYMGSHYDKEADLVLVTHQHYDHNAINKMPHKDSTIVFQNMDAIKAGTYVNTNIYGVDINPVPAYNKNHKINECAGYILNIDGIRLYFAGDTSKTEEMYNIKDIDYAFLPCDGIFNMDASEASLCANIINAKHSVPMHTYPDHLFSEEIAKKFNGINKLVIRPNEEIDL